MQLLFWLLLRFMTEQLNREPKSPPLKSQPCQISKGLIIEETGEKKNAARIYLLSTCSVISKLQRRLQHVNLAKVQLLLFLYCMCLVAEIIPTVSSQRG